MRILLFKILVLVVFALSSLGGLYCLWANRPTNFVSAKKDGLKDESWYVEHLAKACKWARPNSQCDLSSEEFYIEVEWPSKPYEAIGRSLRWSNELGKRPAILFLVPDRNSRPAEHALEQIEDVVKRYDITVWWYVISEENFL